MIELIEDVSIHFYRRQAGEAKSEMRLRPKRDAIFPFRFWRELLKGITPVHVCQGLFYANKLAHVPRTCPNKRPTTLILTPSDSDVDSATRAID